MNLENKTDKNLNLNQSFIVNNGMEMAHSNENKCSDEKDNKKIWKELSALNSDGNLKEEIQSYMITRIHEKSTDFVSDLKKKINCILCYACRCSVSPVYCWLTSVIISLLISIYFLSIFLDDSNRVICKSDFRGSYFINHLYAGNIVFDKSDSFMLGVFIVGVGLIISVKNESKNVLFTVYTIISFAKLIFLTIYVLNGDQYYFYDPNLRDIFGTPIFKNCVNTSTIDNSASLISVMLFLNMQ